MTGETTRADLTRDATEKRARLFGFVEAGAEESDLPAFAAAIDDYVSAVTAIDTHVMEQADRECDEHIAAGRAFRQFAQQVQAWGQQHQARADRYRTRLDRVKAECTALMREVSGLSPVALAGRRDAVSRIQEAARPGAEAVQATATVGDQPGFRQPGEG